MADGKTSEALPIWKEIRDKLLPQLYQYYHDNIPEDEMKDKVWQTMNGFGLLHTKSWERDGTRNAAKTDVDVRRRYCDYMIAQCKGEKVAPTFTKFVGSSLSRMI